MRFSALFSLVAFLWLLAAPLSFADSLNIGICNFSAFGITGYQTTKTTDAEKQAEIEAAKFVYETFHDEYYEADTCGEMNPSTGMIEKGDCTSQVVTEITEVITQAKPSTAEGDKIVDLYHGICCAAYDKTTCYDTRDYYTDTYESCVAIASATGSTAGPNCELRQWLIASTGMGLLKLYVKQIFAFGAFAVGAVALATIILNGVRISVAGVSGDISEAKQKITQALSGIVLLFFAALILYTINPDFFGG